MALSLLTLNPISTCPLRPLKTAFPSYKSFKYLKSLTFHLISSSLAKITQIFFHLYEVVSSNSDHLHFCPLNSFQVVQILLDFGTQTDAVGTLRVLQRQTRPLDLNFTCHRQYSHLNIPERYLPFLQTAWHWLMFNLWSSTPPGPFSST